MKTSRSVITVVTWLAVISAIVAVLIALSMPPAISGQPGSPPEGAE